MYATLNGYRNDNFKPFLFVSDDYGNSWVQLGNDLPAEPLNVVKEDPKKENIIYVGSDNGLYTSFNMGKTFMTVGNNLPRVPIHDIAIQQRDNEIILGTHGRSAYIAKLDDVQKAYTKMKDVEDMKARLKTFDPKDMNAGEANIDCPTAKPKKSKKKKGNGMVAIDMSSVKN